MPCIPKPDPAFLQNLIDSFAALKGSLFSIGSCEEILNALLIQLLTSKLDSETQDIKEFLSWDQCYSILSHGCQLLKNKVQVRTNEIVSKQSHHNKQNTFKRTSLVNTKAICVHCNSAEHFVGYCPSFLLLSAKVRYEFAKRISLCINRLRKDHSTSKCASKSRCRICGLLHHTVLHFDSQSLNTINTNNSTLPSTSQVNPSQVGQVAPVSLLSYSTKRAFIPTAIVLIKDNFGCFQPIRALLDSCSELNFITEEAAKR